MPIYHLLRYVFVPELFRPADPLPQMTLVASLVAISVCKKSDVVAARQNCSWRVESN